MVPSSFSGWANEEMRGDELDTELLRADYEKARTFLLGHKWCFGLGEAYFGDGVGGIARFFLYESIRPRLVSTMALGNRGRSTARLSGDRRLPTPLDALKRYIELRRQWVELAYASETSPEERRRSSRGSVSCGDSGAKTEPLRTVKRSKERTGRQQQRRRSAGLCCFLSFFFFVLFVFVMLSVFVMLFD